MNQNAAATPVVEMTEPAALAKVPAAVQPAKTDAVPTAKIKEIIRIPSPLKRYDCRPKSAGAQ